MIRDNDAAARRIRRRPLLRVIGGGVLGTILTAGTTQASERKLPSTLAITKGESDINDGTANYQVAVSTKSKA